MQSGVRNGGDWVRVDGCSLSGCYQVCGNGSVRLLVLETLAAEHGPSLRWLERNGGFNPALGAFSPGLRSRKNGGRRICTGTQGCIGALKLAGFAALWVIFELFVEEEELFASGEDELTTAVCAG